MKQNLIKFATYGLFGIIIAYMFTEDLKQFIEKLELHWGWLLFLIVILSLGYLFLLAHNIANG